MNVKGDVDDGVPCDQVAVECFCGEEDNPCELVVASCGTLDFKGECRACGRKLTLFVTAERVMVALNGPVKK